ncbi:MAG: alanine--tRNA ligase [Eubacteriales bacterium]|nr:alanine--tRNA ligase [Eubacteriales bacterium]
MQAQPTITADELRKKYLEFFQAKGHHVISSASLIPENDPTVLFTTAGMHPLVPYLMGAKHPAGTRLTDVQKCIRTGDIDDVGDSSHLTFFEMLGNWSLGDYFKEDAIRNSWEFLTSPEWLGISPDRLAFSVFAGDEHAPRDEESASIWRACGVKDDHIFYLPKENNWWGPAGKTGPCGPDTEMFIITDKEPCGPDCSPACDCGRYLEIWNDVFMQYNKTAEGTFEPLQQRNVDTGMGLERTIGVLQGVKSVYETDLLKPIVDEICQMSGKEYGMDGDTDHAIRIVCDHIRSSTFILGDPHGIAPSNVDQGYVLRRLIRRAIRFGNQLGLPEGFPAKLSAFIIDKYCPVYPELQQNREFILQELDREEQRFHRTLQQGLKEFDKLLENMKGFIDGVGQMEYALAPVKQLKDAITVAQQVGSTARPLPELDQMKSLVGKIQQAYDLLSEVSADVHAIKQRVSSIDGVQAFHLYDTYGFPIEMTEELAREHGLAVDKEGFEAAFRKHQATSNNGAQQRFGGGLADHTEATARLHTATHLLNAALRTLLDENITQRGSNITAERLRFDFNFPRKLEPAEIKAVEDWVNRAIEADAPIICEEMPLEQAQARGAMGVFTSKYGDVVKVYTMGEFSCEICGGPHAARTGELGHFSIQKEQASSSGVRRIRAVLTQE